MNVGRQHHAGWHAVFARSHGLHGRRITRPVGAAGHVRGSRRNLIHAGQHKMCGMFVTWKAVSHRTHDRKLIGHHCQSRDMRPDLNSGSDRIDRTELTTDFRGCIGLQIPDILMRRCAGEKQQDHTLRPSEQRHSIPSQRWLYARSQGPPVQIRVLPKSQPAEIGCGLFLPMKEPVEVWTWQAPGRRHRRRRVGRRGNESRGRKHTCGFGAFARRLQKLGDIASISPVVSGMHSVREFFAQIEISGRVVVPRI